MFWPYENICIVSDFPTAVRVDTHGGRLHHEALPALEYADTYGVYSWHGVLFDEYNSWIITNPEQITVDKIDTEVNQEIKRAMLERFTAERYIREGNAVLVHREDKLPGVLPGKERFKNPVLELWDKEIKGTELTMTMVRAINSTPEPDGHFKEYWMEVANDLRPIDPVTGELFGKPQERTGYNAIASMFGLRGEEYYPLLET